MNKKDLLKLLEDVPDDAEIVVSYNCDDILGDYSYTREFTIEEETAYGDRLDMRISNYVDLTAPRKVYVIGY